MGTIARGTKSATGTVNFGASTSAKSSEVNTDLNTIVTAINGNLDNDNIKASAGIVATKLNLGTVAQDIEFTGGITFSGTLTGAAIFGLIYPVGSYYFNDSDSTNPGTLFGVGTWVAVEERVLVGYKSGSSEFGTAGGEYGAKTVTLDGTMIPSHTHTVNLSNASAGGGSIYPSVNVNGTVDTPQATNATGGGLAHPNCQPSRTVFMWRRSA